MGPYTQFFTASNGARIAYLKLGSGLPLIYVPAFISHLDVLADTPATWTFCETLASSFTVIRYDRYGCGLSDRERTDFSPEIDVQVLADLVSHLRLDRYALVGVSSGAPTAIQYAATAPRQPTHLILSGIGLSGSRPQLNAIGDALALLLSADHRLGVNAMADFLLPGGDPEALSWFARLMREGSSRDVMEGLNRAESAHRVDHLLARLRMPTLVLHRKGDRLLTVERASDLAARIPGAQLALLAGDEHILEFGDAAAVIDAIRGFIGDAAPDEPRSHANDLRGASAMLSRRENEVLDLIAAGCSNHEIAARPSISVRTVERHTANIYGKLGVRSRVGAAAVALGQPPGNGLPSERA